MKNNSTKRLCRAGVISALYVVLTYAFSSFAFGPFQVRPAEALCLLPLFLPEAIPALFVGCALSNLLSGYGIYDIVFGSIASLIAGYGTYFIGKFMKNTALKLFFGGLFPVIVNAIIIPFIIVFLCADLGGYASFWTAYFVNVAIFLVTQTVWVYGLGVPLYLTIKKILK
jgi:uncharacterized membrane protein